MTIEELIRFYTEEAEEMKMHKAIKFVIGTEAYERKLQEHTQTAEWLRELQERRKQTEIIRCKDCKHLCNISERNGVCFNFNGFSADMKFDDYCSRAERRTDG